MSAPLVNVLLCSAGRRTYLVRWFRDALRLHEVNGKIIAADADKYAAAVADADLGVWLPNFRDAAYPRELLARCVDLDVRLLISLNDHELSVWSEIDQGPFTARGTTMVTMNASTHRTVEDKYACAALLSGVGLLSPRTLLATDILLGEYPRFEPGSDVIVKHRFGSGSYGIVRCHVDGLRGALQDVMSTARDRSGGTISDPTEAAASVIVQQVVVGHEYGVDVVNDLLGNHVGVLARRKIRMRGGETDQAESVDADEWARLGAHLGVTLGNRGLIDVDVIRDAAGRSWIIDVNARFGGGYPFSHVAGANIPACYIAWHLDRQPAPDWLTPQIGVVGSKFQDVVALPCRSE